MADDTGSVPINLAALKTFGERLRSQFDRYLKDRYPLEQQWMRNIRQYRGIYDPEVKIRPFGSTAYPKFTRKWVNGTVSRLMQMLFPQTEHNWNIEPSPIPELGTQDLQALLNEMQDMAAQAGQEVTDDQIEAQIVALANKKCQRMKKKMIDLLDEIDYPALAKKVVFSGVLFGTGLLSGPFITRDMHRSWRKDSTGRFVVEEKERLMPCYEFESVWDWYPDLSAKTRASQDGYYFRRVMSREQVRALADRPDFMPTLVEWLRTHAEGNFKEQYWELELRADGDRKYATALNKRKYEVLEWWGFVSGHELKAAGVAIPDDKLANQFESNVWSIGGTVIKCIVNPMEKKKRPLNVFVFEDDDLGLAGIGLPQVCRDSQLAICEITRMTLDNASVICTPSKLIKLSLLMPGHTLDSRPYQDWYQDPDAPDNSQDAVKNLTFDSHIQELQQLLQVFKGFGEEEVSLPPISMGDTSQGGSEGARTQGNLSMLMGAASLPIRDNVRNFDLFTDSTMTGLYDWMMEFDSDPAAKGEFSIITRGSTSLIAKEVRAQHFNVLVQGIQPEEREEIDWRKNLSERMKTIDIMPDEILLPEEIVKQNRAARAKKAEEAAALQSAMLQAEIRATIADALKSVSLAKKADSSIEIAAHDELMNSLKQIAEQEDAQDAKTAEHAKALLDHMTQQQEIALREREIDVKEIAARKPKKAA